MVSLRCLPFWLYVLVHCLVDTSTFNAHCWLYNLRATLGSKIWMYASAFKVPSMNSVDTSPQQLMHSYRLKLSFLLLLSFKRLLAKMDSAFTTITLRLHLLSHSSLFVSSETMSFIFYTLIRINGGTFKISSTLRVNGEQLRVVCISLSGIKRHICSNFSRLT